MIDLKRYKKKIVFLLILSVLIVPISSFNIIRAEDPEPFFSIAIICPDSKSSRIKWATLIAEQFPKIGINISKLDIASWTEISPRTWGHPGPYPILNYTQDGFDIVAFTWGFPNIDWDPRGIFDSSSIPPHGNNFYKYSSQDFDQALANYLQANDLITRKNYVEEMQEILYSDLPQMTIFYNQYYYPHDLNFDTSSWDEILWRTDYRSMENWSIPGQTEFHYAKPVYFFDFHIYTCNNDLDKQWLNQIYEGLAFRNPSSPYNRTYSPRLATTYSSTDGLTYNVHINPNAKFADGHVLNASDVEYSYQLITDMDLNPDDWYYWSNYVAADSVSIIDEFEVDITFRTTYAFQDSNLRLPILPKHIWENVDPRS
ncbi:MAG: hypothetical protein HZR80_16585 [Candidatus Heimdallarchaeota archaeon]